MNGTAVMYYPVKHTPPTSRITSQRRTTVKRTSIFRRMTPHLVDYNIAFTSKIQLNKYKGSPSDEKAINKP
jgi:hypothetical protein